MQISYNFLQTAKNDELFKPAIHQYLYDHVRSRFIKVNKEEWIMAINLPVSDFVYKKT